MAFRCRWQRKEGPRQRSGQNLQASERAQQILGTASRALSAKQTDEGRDGKCRGGTESPATTAHPHRKHSVLHYTTASPATVPHPSRLTACHRPTCGARLMRRVLTAACIRSTAALLAACLSLPPAAAARKPPGGGRPRFARGVAAAKGRLFLHSSLSPAPPGASPSGGSCPAGTDEGRGGKRRGGTANPTAHSASPRICVL